MYCNPAAGEECGETAPDDAPYGSIIKVLVPESCVQSFALTFTIKREGEGLSGIVGKVSKQ